MKEKISLDGLFRQNIVLMSGLVTAPVIVAATTAERALILTVSFFMITYPSILLCKLVPRKIAYTVRILIYAVTAAVMYIPTALLMRTWFPETAAGVSIYIEILVVNSLLLAKTESRFYIHSFKVMAIDALIYIAGYAAAAFAVGITRELLAYGTLFGIRIAESPMPAARSPFFGFILVGIFAAICRAVTHRKKPEKEAERIE